MLGAGSSLGVELFHVFMCTGLWQDGADQQYVCFIVCSVHPHTRTLSVQSILVESPFLHNGFASSIPFRRRFRLDKVGHASLVPGDSDSLGPNESLCGVVWCWIRWAVFECGCCHQGLQQSGGSCVMI